jgi:hypothetical protein
MWSEMIEDQGSTKLTRVQGALLVTLPFDESFAVTSGFPVIRPEQTRREILV